MCQLPKLTLGYILVVVIVARVHVLIIVLIRQLLVLFQRVLVSALPKRVRHRLDNARSTIPCQVLFILRHIRIVQHQITSRALKLILRRRVMQQYIVHQRVLRLVVLARVLFIRLN